MVVPIDSNRTMEEFDAAVELINSFVDMPGAVVELAMPVDMPVDMPGAAVKLAMPVNMPGAAVELVNMPVHRHGPAVVLASTLVNMPGAAVKLVGASIESAELFFDFIGSSSATESLH